MRFSLFLLPVLLLTACSSVGAPAANIVSVGDRAGLVAALSQKGWSVIPGESITQPFFAVPAQMEKVDGEDVQVFEFADSASAAAATATIDSSGSSIGTTMVSWVGPPHFFHRAKVVVLYVGSNAEILSALEAALGPQIAGAQR